MRDLDHLESNSNKRAAFHSFFALSHFFSFNQSMRNLINWFELSFCLVLLGSCAAWRSGDVGEVSKLPTDLVAQRKVIKTSLNLKLYEYYSGGQLDKEKTADSREQTFQLGLVAFKEAALFNFVDQSSPNKEMSVEISVIRKKESNLALDILTAATLYLIPKRTNEEITVSAKFFNKKGELLGMVEKQDTVIMWHQTFMIFALPFAYPTYVRNNVLTDLCRSIILEAITEGYFVELGT